MDLGDEIDCTCPRCRLILTHVVLYFDVDGAIGGVECRTCGAQHPYRPGRRRIIHRPPPSPITVRSLLEGGSYQERMARLGEKPTIPYSMERRFAAGEAITHPRFGVGFVLRVRDRRIEVLFHDGIKVLVHSGEGK